jgi:biotin-dependent carboxylase-like uncharacterized protein
MSTLEIVAIGPISSVQDRGRYGAQRYGLTPSGAVDVTALAAANALAGNPLFAAAIELGPFGATFRARDGALHVALAGATRPATIEGRALRWPQSLTLQAGETLTLGFTREGPFSYLAVSGGIAGEPVFGSLSVNARAGLGAPYPRPLQAGDIIEVGSTPPRGDHTINLAPAAEGPIRVVLGPQDDEFDDANKAAFLGADWTISPTSDRMGFRLDGPAIKHMHGHNIVSDGTVLGSIQVPGNGAPIVLMPDRGTSGGYPKIATIISADIGRLAQMPAGRIFRFSAVSIEQAQAAARHFAAQLQSLPGRVAPLRTQAFDLEALAHANVAGAAVNATDAQTWQSVHDQAASDGAS